MADSALTERLEGMRSAPALRMTTSALALLRGIARALESQDLPSVVLGKVVEQIQRGFVSSPPLSLRLTLDEIQSASPGFLETLPGLRYAYATPGGHTGALDVRFQGPGASAPSPERSESNFFELVVELMRGYAGKRQVIQALDVATAKYQSLVEHSPAITYIAGFDVNATALYVSPQIQSILGVTPEEWVNRPGAWFASVHPEDKERVASTFSAPSSDLDGDMACEYRLLARDGRVVWVEDRAVVVHDGDGSALFIQGSIIDISERKAAQAALEDSERRYRLLADNITDLVWTTGLDLRVTYVSPSVTQHLGYSPEEALGKAPDFYLMPESYERAIRLLGEDQDRERAGFRDVSWLRTLELEYRCKDGTGLWAEVKLRVIRDGAGQPVGLLGVSRDIRLRRAAERALKDSQDRLRMLESNLSDVIYTQDLDFRRTYVSPSVLAMRGFTVEEAMAQSMDEMMTPASVQTARRVLQEEFALEALGRARPRSMELEMKRKDGSTVWVESRTTFLRDAQGKAVGILGVVRDISERRQVTQMKADFAALTTHQLRTPLTGIKWMLELAADAAISEETRGYIQDARDSAERLVQIVNNLLDSATLESGTLNVSIGPVNLAEVTTSVLAEMQPQADERRLRVRVEGAQTVGTVPADAQLLRQALVNLVSNAVKYTPPGGAVTVRMTREPGQVRWEIEDTGIGVPKAGQARLFEKFYRADNASTIAPEGTGLGLHLVRMIVGRFGGHVWCESEEGRGARFVITLPAER